MAPPSPRARRVLFACGLAALVVGCVADERPAGDPARFTLTVPEVSVPSGTEGYLCYTVTLDRSLVVERFVFEGRRFVHHFLLSQALAPATDGLEPCDVFFRTSWLPLFASGTGRAELAAPEGAGWHLHAGDQLVVQLHLLNPDVRDVDEPVPFEMHLAPEETAADLAPIGLYAFGTTELSLAPEATTAIVNDCVVDKRVEAFAIFPHMHMLGRRLILEAGPSADTLAPVFEVSAWDFDRQSIEPFPLVLEAGTHTRVTCEFDNPHAEEVGFGESSYDEMCFLVTFVTGGASALDGCLTLTGAIGGDDPPRTGACGDDAPNGLGVGAACTRGGGECAPTLGCSADLGGDEEAGWCLRLGCETSADCGGGAAVRCTPERGGGLLNICITNNCRPDPCPVR